MTGPVLVVEHSLTVRMDLVEAFQANGFEAVPCATATEARAQLASRPADALVIDSTLPDVDGVDFVAELRGSPETAALTILLLSADPAEETRGLCPGADEYLRKPCDAEYVVTRTRQLIGTRDTPVTTVLLIDDSLTYRMEFQRILEGDAYHVLLAASGEEGLRIAADERPGAIIVDGELPGIDGATVIRRVRLDAALREVPCLLLTAATGHDTELRAFEAGADAFVTKGEDPAVILARLGAILRQARAVAPLNERGNLYGPKRVLIADDNETYLQSLGAMLRDEGYEVILARSGEEALKLLAGQQVDCILIDLFMPGLDGRETCQRIKAVPTVRDIPLVMMTALDDGDAVLLSLGIGADDYLCKTDEMDILKARVRAQIRRKQIQDENRNIREELLRKEREAAEARAAKELAETRAALVEQLEWQNKELETFSYSVSHDLRNPLQIVGSLSEELLDDYADRLDDRGRDRLRRINAAALRMTDLITALLQLSRANRGELSTELVDISALATEVATELQRAEPERPARFSVAPAMTVHADRGLIRALLENLLGNAWKFTRRTACTEIEVSHRQDGGKTIYFVRDNGAGFQSVDTDAVFQPFQRLHDAREFPGTGIGLATAHRIVDRHGGRIWARGEVGRGATFSFTLERQEPD
jgi:DNA-binding response OmpR family regulator